MQNQYEKLKQYSFEIIFTKGLYFFLNKIWNMLKGEHRFWVDTKEFTPLVITMSNHFAQ